MKNNNDEISKLIYYEMNNNYDYKNSFIEGDAYCFSFYVMSEILNIDYIVSSDTKNIIEKFLKSHSFRFLYRE